MLGAQARRGAVVRAFVPGPTDDVPATAVTVTADVTTNTTWTSANVYLLDPATARAWCRRGLGQPGFSTLAHGHSTVVDLLGHAMALQGDVTSARELTEELPGNPVARRLLELLAGRRSLSVDGSGRLEISRR